MNQASLRPDWIPEVLACPRCKGDLTAELRCERCGNAGTWAEGIACFGAQRKDPSVAWYEAKGGSHFRERMNIPFTMSSLDTPVYHSYLAELKPSDQEAIIIDVGAGDGRNCEPWLSWGYKRIIALDATFASLARFREHLAKTAPQWMKHVALVQCDARQLPLRGGIADAVLAIEALYYLNEDYHLGLAECARLLGRSGRILLSEPAREGSYLSQLLYGGIGDMLKLRDRPACYEKATAGAALCSRNFMEDELRAAAEAAGLSPLEQKGMSSLSTVLGYLRGEGKLTPADQTLFPAVCEFLKDMGKTQGMRRTHVMVAVKL